MEFKPDPKCQKEAILSISASLITSSAIRTALVGVILCTEYFNVLLTRNFIKLTDLCFLFRQDPY